MIKKILDLISQESRGMRIEIEARIGLVLDCGAPRFQMLDQPGKTGVMPQILSPALLVFEKPKGMEIMVYIQQQMPAVVQGAKLEPVSGYEYENSPRHLIVRRYLWPGDYDEDIILAVYEEICQDFSKIYLLYCQEISVNKSKE